MWRLLSDPNPNGLIGFVFVFWSYKRYIAFGFGFGFGLASSALILARTISCSTSIQCYGSRTRSGSDSSNWLGSRAGRMQIQLFCINVIVHASTILFRITQNLWPSNLYGGELHTQKPLIQPVLRIRITLMRIRIRLFTLMRIRIRMRPDPDPDPGSGSYCQLGMVKKKFSILVNNKTQLGWNL